MFICAVKPNVLSTRMIFSRINLFNTQTSRGFHDEQTSSSTSFYEIRTPVTDLDQFGGYQTVKNSLADVVHYLQYPKAYIKAGINPPKGVLLSGPPGVGKTMLAEAVAGHSGVPIIISCGSDMLDKWVGGAEEKLRHLFAVAQQHAPCVLLIDEFDSIAGERFASPKTANERHDNAIVNELLSLLSKKMQGVVVMATTNHAASLDAAVTRAGRFDRHIIMSMPNSSDRLAIIERCIERKPLDKAIKVSDLAAISANFSGAKLAAWINEAAIMALKENSKTIKLYHLDKARSIIQRGSIGSFLTNEKKIKVAQHESGHALVGYLLGSRIYKISVLKAGQSLGLTEFISVDKDGVSKEGLLNHICICLAGRAAELAFSCSEVGSSNDLKHAKKWAEYLVMNEGLGSSLTGLNGYVDIEKILQSQMVRAQQLLLANEAIFHKLVRALAHANELYEKEFLSVLNGTYVESTASKVKLDKEISSTLPKKKSQSIIADSRFFNAKTKQHAKGSAFFNTPFTIDEVANAIDVEPRDIDLIEFGESPGWYIIAFKPSFIKKDEFCEKLTAHHIEHDYDSIGFKLQIKPKGVDDFIRFIQHVENKPYR